VVLTMIKGELLPPCFYELFIVSIRLLCGAIILV